MPLSIAILIRIKLHSRSLANCIRSVYSSLSVRRLIVVSRFRSRSISQEVLECPHLHLGLEEEPLVSRLPSPFCPPFPYLIFLSLFSRPPLFSLARLSFFLFSISLLFTSLPLLLNHKPHRLTLSNKPLSTPSPSSSAVSPMKRKIETKYRLPLLNWSSLPATQISGTVFTQLDDEAILRSFDFSQFEEVFKLAKQGTPSGNDKVETNSYHYSKLEGEKV